jgi:hypothetical protein
MKTVFGFSALLFAPLLIALLLPALFLLPSGLLLAATGVFDPTLSITESAGYYAWVSAPILAAVVLFLVGTWFHSIYVGGRSRRTLWAAIWMVFSAALFACRLVWNLHPDQYWSFGLPGWLVPPVDGGDCSSAHAGIPARCGTMALCFIPNFCAVGDAICQVGSIGSIICT